MSLTSLFCFQGNNIMLNSKKNKVTSKCLNITLELLRSTASIIAFVPISVTWVWLQTYPSAHWHLDLDRFWVSSWTDRSIVHSINFCLGRLNVKLEQFFKAWSSWRSYHLAFPLISIAVAWLAPPRKYAVPNLPS